MYILGDHKRLVAAILITSLIPKPLQADEVIWMCEEMGVAQTSFSGVRSFKTKTFLMKQTNKSISVVGGWLAKNLEGKDLKIANQGDQFQWSARPEDPEGGVRAVMMYGNFMAHWENIFFGYQTMTAKCETEFK